MEKFCGTALILVLFTMLALVTGVKVLWLSHDTQKHETSPAEHFPVYSYTASASCATCQALSLHVYIVVLVYSK